MEGLKRPGIFSVVFRNDNLVDDPGRQEYCWLLLLLLLLEHGRESRGSSVKSVQEENAWVNYYLGVYYIMYEYVLSFI
jgi:hypothetical protein